MSAVALDRKVEKKIRVEGQYAPDKAVLQPIKHVPQGLSAASSIDQAKGEASAPRHRPQLTPPKQHYMLDLLDLHREVEGTVMKELTVFKTQSTQDLAEIERLEKEKDEALRKNAKDAASRDQWGVLGNVAQYLAAGTSIAVGVSLGGGWCGACLVASGVAGLGNRFVRDTVGWQSVAGWFSKSVENQKKLVQRIEMGFLAVELGTGLAGGVGTCITGGYSALANAPRLDTVKKMVGSLQTTGSYMIATSRLGRSFADQRISDLQARLRILDAQAEDVRMEMSQQARSAREMIDMAHSIGQEMHKAIAASEIHDL